MAIVKIFEYERSSLLRIAIRCVVIFTLIKHISTSSTIATQNNINNESSTKRNILTSSSIPVNKDNLTTNNLLPNISQTLDDKNSGVRDEIAATSTENNEETVTYFTNPTEGREMEDEFIITETDNETSFTYSYTTKDPIYDYEEMSTTKLIMNDINETSIFNLTDSVGSAVYISPLNESLTQLNDGNGTGLRDQMYINIENRSQIAETIPETTTLKSSTKHGERTSKVFEDINNNDGTLFQFWTTLSGNSFSKHTETTINVMHESKSNNTNDMVLIFPLNSVTTTPATTVINLNHNTEIIEDITEIYTDIPSPDNDLAKNAEDAIVELQNKTKIDTTESSESVDNISLTNFAQLDMNFMEAADYGMMKMNELYGVQEPKLYQMGLILERDDPARFVAAFNSQSEEAKNISKFGYASLQAYMYLHDKFPDELESRASIEQDEEKKENESDQNIPPRPPRPTPPRSSSLRQQCPLRSEPRCTPASKRYRTHDGTCNNFRRLRWGSALSAVQRFLPPEYGDGVQSVRRARSGDPLPSARAVSEAVHTAETNHEAMEAPVTHMLMQWGQFLDHDITSSSQARGFNGSIPKCCESGGRGFMPSELLHPECLPISIPVDDSFYAPRGIRCLEFVRSSPAPRSGCEFGYREQLNQVTAFIDGSPVYSSSAKQSDKLRLFRNGLLQYGRVQARRPVLPPDVDDEEALCRGGAVDASCFKSGDGRVNEHPGLVAMHIVWLRKHNRLATELSHINPHWSDEKIYQETRKIIGAFIQHITYREFLPIVLGPEVMRLFDLQLKEKGYFKGYTTKVNPNPANSFGAAAFRFGHSLVQDTFMRYDRFHRPIHNSVSLHKELTNPSNIWSFGAVDRLLLGLMNQPSQKRDEFISPELTNHLFQSPRFSFGMDLASINVQRGRDHGIPPYVQWREPCGLSSVIEWEDLLKIMPLRAVRNLEKVYRDVEDIDLFTGGMAERPVIGGLVGPTFACIIAQQFSNLRKGDRFWYENGGFESSFTPAQLQQIRKITLAQVLCQTMENVETLQPFAFLIPDNLRNERIFCNSDTLNNFDLAPWTEGNINTDNDISNSDQITKFKFTTTSNTFTPHSINGLLSDSFTSTNKNTMTKNKKTTTHKPFNIDDKLDILVPERSTVTNFNNAGFQNKQPDIHTTESTFTKLTLLTKLTTKPAILLDDKLDFFSKKNKNSNAFSKNSQLVNQTSKRSFPVPVNKSIDNLDINNRQPNEQHISTATDKSVTNSDIELKTFSLTNKMPFFSLFTGFLSTPMPKLPTRKSEIIVYQQDTATTKKPQKYTYLINIVPKPTTPKYDDKEIVKITVQSDLARPLPNRRPIYNNNKLEYRPIDYDDKVQDNRPQYNRPFGNVDKYDTNDNYRPVPTYLGSHVPINNNQVSTPHNTYGFSTFTNLETTTKRYDLFNRPVQDYDNNYQQDNSFNRPTALHDSNYVKPKPNKFQSIKPSSTGITIYIDNKVQVKPVNHDDNIGNNNNYNSQSSEETDNTPLFTRPNYNRPLLHKPLTDYYNTKPLSDSNNHYYDQNTNNDNNHFITWTHRPDPPHDSPDTDYNSYMPIHKEKPQPTLQKPKRPYVTPRPSHVSLHLASQYGNHQPNDISIVINPLLDYKSTSNSRTTPPTTTTKKPTKYYYVRNVLYKYTPPMYDESSNSSKGITNRRHHEIIKENYNNRHSQQHSFINKLNRKNCASSPHSYECISQEIIKSKSNISPSNNVESKESDDELTASSRQNNPSKFTAAGKQDTVDRVFFDVIPSENSPVRWLYFQERPENNSIKFIMPQISSDPLASKELPRPITLTKFSNTFNQIKKRT